MGNSISVTTDETKADPYAWKNVLALPLVGSNIDVSDQINCTTSAKTLSANGDAASSGEASNFYAESFKFDGSGDYLGATSNSDFAMGTGDFTLECWVYRTGGTGFSNFITTRGAAGTTAGYTFGAQGSSNGYDVEFYTNGLQLDGGTQDITFNKWHHVAVTRTGTTLSSYVNGILNTTTTNSQNFSNTSLAVGMTNDGSQGPMQGHLCDVRVYKGVAKYSGGSVGDQVFVVPSTSPDIVLDSPSGVATKSKLKKITDGSVYFDGASDNLLINDHNDLDFGTGAFTIECYLYMNSYGTSGSYPSFVSKYTNSLSWILRARNTGKLIWYSSTGGGTNNESSTNPMVLKKWLHIAAVREGTGTNQMKVYVDGKLHLTVTDANDYNDSNNLCIGSQNTGNTNVIDGYVSNVRIVKGSAVYTSEFIPPTRELTNITNTKLLCCQSNTSATAAAVIPTGSITANGNATASNFNPFNTDISTIRGQEGAYATFNPLDRNSTASLSNGNLNWKTVNGNGCCRGTISVSSGKWYFEFLYVEKPSGGGTGFGILSVEETKEFMGGSNAPDGYSYYSEGASFTKKYNNGSNSNYGDSFAPGDLISVALDMDNGTITFYKNGVSQGQAYSGISGTYAPAVVSGTGTGTAQCYANFGQKPFKFPPPDDFQPLTSSILRPDTVITHPKQYFSAKLYTGNGATSVGGSGGTQTIDVGYKPDLVWIKDLIHGSHDHNLLDTIRGVNSILISNWDGAPVTNSTDAFTAFTDNGFTLGDNGEGTQSLELNKGGHDYVVWSWVAGGSSNTFNVDDIGYASAAAAGLDGGNRNPTAASVGTRQGFSIIKWSGNRSANTTISHGLNSAVKFYFVKNLDRSSDWITWHTGLPGGGDGFIRLNTTGHSATASSPWSSTIPTDSVFTVGADTEANGDGEDMIAYLWSDVPGLQKFGSFTGNGQQNNFVELGFRPAIVWVKRAVANSGPDTSTNYSSWVIMDSARLSYNGLTPNHLYVNKHVPPGFRGNGTNTSNLGDMLLEPHSNGFFMNNYGSEVNSNTSQYIYCAWAEQPYSNLYGATSNAR